jgi:hypothetical protein
MKGTPKDILKIIMIIIGIVILLLNSIILYKRIKKPIDFKQYKNTTIIYKKNMEPAVKLISTHIEAANIKDDEMFGKQQLPDLQVYLYGTDDISQFSNGKISKDDTMFFTYTGYFIYGEKNHDYRINLLIKNLDELISNKGPFFITLTHEYSHYRLRAFTNSHGVDYNKVPEWFDEGIAHYNSGRIMDMPSIKVNLKDLTTYEQYNKVYTYPKDPYAESYCAVNYLIKHYGQNIITNILLNLKDNDFNQSLKLCTNKTLDEFQNDLFKNYK